MKYLHAHILFSSLIISEKIYLKEMNPFCMYAVLMPAFYYICTACSPRFRGEPE